MPFSEAEGRKIVQMFEAKPILWKVDVAKPREKVKEAWKKVADEFSKDQKKEVSGELIFLSNYTLIVFS
jgi:hypothetical protein